ncbi:unnamed protein product [Phytophthora fragariaefolia]|uniref:Unnamed protein product n=1 Tax=Phytophthora fragariaefolia TaxID=1490495 RepID=A0A9W6XMT4_9STRA|nr:unnamed protein product [Phytophthora fragariaefolia]
MQIAPPNDYGHQGIRGEGGLLDKHQSDSLVVGRHDGQAQGDAAVRACVWVLQGHVGAGAASVEEDAGAAARGHADRDLRLPIDKVMLCCCLRSSRAAADKYFSTAEAFAAWDREALAAHLAGALTDQPDGSVTLACDPRLEASLYSMEALHFSDQELQRPKCPICFHWGTKSHMCFEKMLKAIETKFPHLYATRKGMPGLGHLVVMEDPALTAENIAYELLQLQPFAQANAKL